MTGFGLPVPPENGLRVPVIRQNANATTGNDGVLFIKIPVIDAQLRPPEFIETLYVEPVQTAGVFLELLFGESGFYRSLPACTHIVTPANDFSLLKLAKV